MKTLKKLSADQKAEVHSYIKKLIAEIKESTTFDSISSDITTISQNRNTTPRIHQRRSSLFDDCVEDVSSQDSDEFTMYLNRKINQSELVDFDPISWWRNNNKDFPILFKKFLRINASPSTSAPAERSFNKSGHILCDLRSSLEPKFVEDLVLAGEQFRKINELNDLNLIKLDISSSNDSLNS